MSASRCPNCMDEVRIPAGVPDSAVVRCPLCEEEYKLSDVGLPPLLQVVSGAESLVGAAVGAESEGGFTLAPAKPAGEAAEEAMPAFSLSGDSAPAGDITAPRPSTATRRPARKKGSAIREMVKIVGGGVVGLAIGQLALWYLPGEWKTKQRDPFGLGPHIAKVVPWLVPEQVSGQSSTSPLTPDNGDQSNGGNDSGTGGAVALNDVPDLGSVGMNANNQNDGGKKKKGKGKNRKGNGRPPAVVDADDPDDNGSGDAATPTTDPGDTQPSVDVPDVADPLATIGEPPSIDDPLATIGETPTIDDPLATVGEPPAAAGAADDLVAGINAAREANQRLIKEWAELTTDEKLSVSKGYYDQLVKVSKALDDLGPNNKIARNRTDELRELFQVTETNTAPRNTIYHFGSEQMDAGTPGPVALYGIVQSVGKIDEQPVLRLELKGGGTALVLCPGPHDGTYEKGKGMFLFGTRLSDDDHEYDDPQVVKASVLAVQ